MRPFLPALLTLTAAASAQFTVDDGTIIGFDATTAELVEYTGGAITETLKVTVPSGVPVGVTEIDGSIWVTSTAGVAYEVDLNTGLTINSFPITANESLGNLDSELLGLVWMGSVVNRYDTSGNLLGSINLPGAQPCTGLDTSPTMIFVADYNTGLINTFDHSGSSLGAIATGIPGSNLSGLTYDAGSDTVWVSTGFGADDIRNYDLSGNLLSSFPTNSPWINGLHFVGESSGPIGTNYCGPANLNSTGQSAEISGFGSDKVAANNVTLTAVKMPQNQFGYFLNSMTLGFIPFPGGSQGNLCLAGSIGRHSAQIQNTGPGGEFSIPVDLTMLPTPSGPYSVMAGETWHFQAWFRDVNPMPTSNFTDGLKVLFQ